MLLTEQNEKIIDETNKGGKQIKHEKNGKIKKRKLKNKKKKETKRDNK